MQITIETLTTDHQVDISIKRVVDNSYKFGGHTITDEDYDFEISGIPQGMTEEQVIDYAMDHYKEDLFAEYLDW